MDITYEDRQGAVELEEKLPAKLRYAGFWMRFWAYLLDIIIVFSLNGILIFPILRWLELTNVNIGVFTLEGMLTALVGFIYFVIMTKYGGQTLGKKVFGVKVIGKDQEVLSWSTVIFREVIGKFISQTLLMVGYLIVAFTKRKQGLHDIFADTYVIHEEE